MAQRFEEIRRRAIRAKEFGFRALFHFGAPHIERIYTKLANLPLLDRETEANSVSDSAVVARHQRFLSRLAQAIPEIDDLLMYTYDQEAWLGDEFGNDKTARGIPLHERLPSFLSALSTTWGKYHPDGILWWEPWEITAGDGLRIIAELPQKNFGLMLHGNIGEVQAAHPVDPWVRNMAALAGRRGIPAVGELFLGSSNQEVFALTHVPVPSLAYHQLREMRSVEGITGVKEYFGLLPDRNDPTLEMTALCFQHPAIDLKSALSKLAEKYGRAGGHFIQGWTEASLGYQLAPWDASWFMGQIWAYGPRTYANKRSYHDWQAYNLKGQGAYTPVNRANRRAIFILTANEVEHNPWLIEDLGWRCSLAAEHLERGAAALRAGQALLEIEALRRDVSQWVNDLTVLKVVLRDRSLHALETIAAYNIRRYMEEKQSAPEACYARLEKLLQADVANQSEYDMPLPLAATAATKLQEYTQNREQWVRSNLVYRWPVHSKLEAVMSAK